VLDDLHWADPETVEVLDYMADNLAEEPLACLVTLRNEEPCPVAEWLSTICARRVARRIDVPRLTFEQSLELARACLDVDVLPNPLERFLGVNAEGLPLLVEDLLAELVSSGTLVREGDRWSVTGSLLADVPRTFAHTVHRRLAALDADAHTVLAAAAVLGRRFDWTLLAGMTGYDRAGVLAALRAAVERQIISGGEAGEPRDFRFRHALTRDVVLSRLLPPERAALARVAADLIEAEHPGVPDEWCGLAARLRADAGEEQRAAELLLEAGRRALDSGALASAETILRRARATAPEAALADAVDVRLTEVLALAGQVDQVFTIGEAVLARLGPGTDPRQKVAVRLRLARAAATAGQWERARAHVDAVVGTSGDQEPVIRADGLRAVVAIGSGRIPDAELRGAAVLERAEQAQLWDVACETLGVLGRCARLRDAAEAERLFERAHRTADEHGLELERIQALHELGTIDLFETGRTDRLRAARRLATQAGALVTTAHIDLHLGILLGHADEVDAARRSLEDSIATATRLRLPELRRVGLAQLGYVLALAGRAQEAEPHVRRVLDDARQDHAHLLAAGLARPFLALLDDDRPAAIRALDAIAPALPDGTWPQWGLRALLRTVEGDPAAAVADAEQAAAPGMPPRLNRAYLGFARAVLAGREGDAGAAADAFAAADLELGWQTAHRRFCWRHVAEAALVDGWGDPVRWLRAILPVFEDHRAGPVVVSCRSLLQRAGVPVPRRARGEAAVPPPLAGLGVTSREVDVLAMVVQGRSNPEIAARLHLSRRTVESHVARLLAKTGVARRQDLDRFADSVSPPP
jgi:DNA-binding CsgD family transcriptional regulator/tetratricopeptide (TPR) repeat protein